MTLYRCTFDRSIAQTGNWLGRDLALTHDEASGEAQVNDALIQHVMGGPIAARKVDETKKRITFSWSVTAKDVSHETGEMRYRLTFYRQTGRVSVAIKPIGYDNAFSGQGSCVTSTL